MRVVFRKSSGKCQASPKRYILGDIMKKTALKKKSSSSTKKLQDKLWELCRRIRYELDKDSNGRIDCYTCGAKDIISHNRQLGHLWAKATLGAYLKYDLRVLRWQCMKCNQFYGGQGAIFYSRLLAEEGEEYLEKLVQDKQVTVKSSEYYEKLLREYEKTLELL